MFLSLYLRGVCDKGGPFWRKGRSYLHFLQEVDSRRPANLTEKVRTNHRNLFTPWSRVLLEKLTVSQLVKKYPAFYGT